MKVGNNAEDLSEAALIVTGQRKICIGDAAAAVRDYELLGEVLGDVHGICAQRSEIFARVASPDHYITRRVDPSFAVLESVYLLDVVPPDAEILWRASWHYAPYTLA